MTYTGEIRERKKMGRTKKCTNVCNNKFPHFKKRKKEKQSYSHAGFHLYHVNFNEHKFKFLPILLRSTQYKVNLSCYLAREFH